MVKALFGTRKVREQRVLPSSIGMDIKRAILCRVKFVNITYLALGYHHTAHYENQPIDRDGLDIHNIAQTQNSCNNEHGLQVPGLDGP